MRPPRWARICDGLALAALILGVFVLLFGGFSITPGPYRLSIRSPGRLLFVALALIAIRHAAFPSDPLHRRVLTWWRGLQGDAPGTVAAAALVSRAAVLVVGYFAVLTIGPSASEVGMKVSADPLLDLPARFDAGWYGGIAQDGYYFQGRFDRQQNIAFFPAYPMLMRAGAYVVGGFKPGTPPDLRMARTLWAGTIISLIAFAWAAAYLVRLARDTIGEERAVTAVWLLAAYPFALFFSTAYTESVFLLGAVAAFYHFRREQWAAAATWGFLVGLTRPNGCFLSVPLGLMALQYLRPSPQRPESTVSRFTLAVAAASASGLGMLAYGAYVKHVTGSWFGWARLQETWGRSYQGLAPVQRGFGWIVNEGLFHVFAGLPFDTLNAFGLVFVLALLWPVARRIGVPWAVFILLNVVPPLLAGGVLSMGRITATLFPVFLALAAILPRRAVLPFVTASAIGQGLAAALFFTWRPLF